MHVSRSAVIVPLFVLLISSFAIISCEQQPNRTVGQPAPSASAAPPSALDILNARRKAAGITDSELPDNGRYVFYPETRQQFGGGHLLDTATGDLWNVGYDRRPDGQLGGEVLFPVVRKPQPKAVNNDPAGIR